MINIFPSEQRPSSGNSLRPHESFRNKRGRVSGYTTIKSGPLPGLTSPTLRKVARPQYLPGLVDVERYGMAVNSDYLPFENNMAPIALPTPIPWQEWGDPLQLAEREAFDPTFSPQNLKPYTGIDCPQVTWLSYAPVPVDDRLSQAGAINLSPHLDHLVNDVRLFLASPSCTLVMKRIPPPLGNFC
jgi:hypothetical protein